MFLSISYSLHLVATVIWLGALFVMALLALTALRQQTISGSGWLTLQRRLLPWIQASLVVLLVTGFYQMTVDPEYGGFLVVDGLWAWALLLKHIAFGGLVVTTLYWQFGLLPDMERLQVIMAQRPPAAAGDQEALQTREKRLLWVNCLLALVILVFTGIMTAV